MSSLRDLCNLQVKKYSTVSYGSGPVLVLASVFESFSVSPRPDSWGPSLNTKWLDAFYLPSSPATYIHLDILLDKEGNKITLDREGKRMSYKLI